MAWSKVLVADSPVHASLAKIALEAEDLTVQLRQMDLWSVAVEVIHSEGAAPSVWVLQEQAEQAKQILKRHQEKLQTPLSQNAPDWLCQQCNEYNASNFGCCWYCGQSAPS